MGHRALRDADIRNKEGKMASIDDTLNVFFDVINGTNLSGTGVGTSHYQDSQYLIDNVFCGNNLPLPYPWVGITDHGPQFQGSAAVKILFDELFLCFDTFVLLPQVSKVGKNPVVPSVRLYGQGGGVNMVSVQTVLHGTYVTQWFKDGHAPASAPISGIVPDKLHVMEIPASAVFAFDNKNKVSQLAAYLDRYKLQQQLTPAGAINIGQVISALEGFLRKDRPK
jgi:hypothetical protein